MDNIVDRDLLTEGSVWVRENGKRNTVLFLTNRTLNSKIQKSHPPQVVYTDEQGNIFNQSVTNFLKTRTFINVNPTMEMRCLALTRDMESEDDIGSVDADTDTLTIAEEDESPEEPEASSVIARFMNGGNDVPAEGSVSEGVEVIASIPPVEFFPLNDPTLPVTIGSQELQDALASYEVAPNLERNMMSHTLTFRCDSNEVANNIFKAFHGSNHQTNLLYGFRVHSPASETGSEEIIWTASLGVYPYIVDGDNYVRVMVMSPSPVPSEGESEGLQPNAPESFSEATVETALPSDLLERVEAVMEAEKAETKAQPEAQVQ